MVGTRSFGPKEDNEDSWGRDIETGLKARPRFKDVVELAIAQRTTHELKKQLTEGIDSSRYKKYRKTDDEVINPAATSNPSLTAFRLSK